MVTTKIIHKSFIYSNITKLGVGLAAVFGTCIVWLMMGYQTMTWKDIADVTNKLRTSHGYSITKVTVISEHHSQSIAAANIKKLFFSLFPFSFNRVEEYQIMNDKASFDVTAKYVWNRIEVLTVNYNASSSVAALAWINELRTKSAQVKIVINGQQNQQK